jgi:hypothetical protein
MPDTYISQFSGEEIDSALRAAQIISGADTPAELRKKLEIRGDTIPVSATDPTPVSEALTASGGGVNPNLLDNWFFGRPVNQKGGYIIPAGVEYNDLSWNHAGTTDKAYPVVGYSGQDPLITIDGTNYIVGKSAQVPGYCTIGYTIDRWKLDIGETVTLEDGCICLKKPGTYWGEYFADFDQFIGMTLTGSVLLSDGTLRTGSFVYNGLLNQGQIFFSSELGFYVKRLSSSITQCEINSLVDNVKIKAAKLELGDTQTLAHKEGDKWVLNEIPDFGEQLRRCQRYFVRLTNAYGYGWTYNSSIANFFVSLPTTMRVNPVIKLTTNGEIQTINGAKSVTGFEAKGIHPNGFAIDLHNSANALITGTPVTWHSSSMDISADL